MLLAVKSQHFLGPAIKFFQGFSFLFSKVSFLPPFGKQPWPRWLGHPIKTTQQSNIRRLSYKINV